MISPSYTRAVPGTKNKKGVETMKGILKRLALVALVAVMAMMASLAMAEVEPVSVFAFINDRYETLGYFEDWSLDEKAAFSTWLEMQTDEDSVGYRTTKAHGLPGEGNMTLEEAVELARQGIIAKYDIKEGVLHEKFKVIIDFYIYFENHFIDHLISPDNPLWSIIFQVIDYNDMDDLENYYVYINDKTGEMEIRSSTDAQG